MSLEAMKQALDKWLAIDEGVSRFGMKLRPEWVSAASVGFAEGYEAGLRQAIEQAEESLVKSYCGGKPNYCTPEVSPEVAGEDTGEVGACVTCGAPKGEWLVDAVNISQECVDEMAKRKHEPWPSVKCTCGGTIYFKYTPPVSDYHEGWEEGFKPAKREWVGLTDNEEEDMLKGSKNAYDAIKRIEAKLKEKNT